MAHINSFVRIPLLAIRQRFNPLPRIGILDEDTVHLRVWPNDIDFNFHLNNSRYLTCMDYGRIHNLAAVGILDNVINRRWTPLVGSVDIVYRRSLPLWARFTLTSQTLCWDEKWFYSQQIIRSREGLASAAWVKALFQQGGKNIPPQQIAEQLHPGLESPPVSESLKQWNELTREKLQSGGV